jgi:penicillin amidase
MPKWLKISITISVTVIILIVAAGLVFYNMLNASLPEYNGTVSVQGISDKVEIYRDSMAVPYILAKTENDAAFALGYLHAQERMFQMDLIRRAGEGRLSEIFGSSTLLFDKMFRTAGLKRAAEKMLAALKPEMSKFLEAYSGGVNQYIKEAKGRYPVEFDVLDYDPYEWQPVHSLIIVRMMAWELNISWWTDLIYTNLVQALGEEKVIQILPDWDENAPFIIPPEVKNYPKITTAIVDIDKDFRNFIGIDGTHIGSNNWAVGDSISATGKPIIANDPHLAFSAPGKWYAAVIRSDKWNVDGVTIPGIPGVVIGKNKNISWTLTNIMLDDADFYIEQIDSAGQKYFFNNKWNDLNIYEEEIKVKDSLDVKIKIRSTHRGPLISDIHPYTFIFPFNNYPALSMRWVGNDTTEELNSFYLINRAANWNEFESAVSLFSVPGQNFVYADDRDNICYLFGGKIPKRESPSPTFVYDGTTDKYDWKGFVSPAEIPVLINPQQNFIATANNKVIKNFKYHISNLWEPSSRIERINYLLKKKDEQSVEDFKNYQLDLISPYAEKMTGYILSAFKDVEITDDNLNLCLEIFREWDFEMNEFSQVPAVYSVFFRHLLKNTYEDEMGEDLFNEFIFVASIPYRSILRLLSNPEHPWFNNIKTTKTETRDDIIRKSLVDALGELELQFGKDVKNWQWGILHKVVFKHSFSGAYSLIDKYIDIGPFPVGGDGSTLFNTEYSLSKRIEGFPRFDSEPFENIVGPSMRYIFDFSRPDEFNLILTTGQSGNVMSIHYRDMAEMWLRGKYLTIRTDEESIRSNELKLVLTKIK